MPEVSLKKFAGSVTKENTGRSVISLIKYVLVSVWLGVKPSLNARNLNTDVESICNGIEYMLLVHSEIVPSFV